MKNYLFLLIINLFTISQIINGQTSNNQTNFFEGKIIYDMKFIDKTGEMSKKEAKMLIGDKQTYTFKNGKYKSETNGMMKTTQLYPGKDTIYNHFKGSKNLLWINATKNSDELISYKIKCKKN